MGSETFARKLVHLASSSLQDRFGVQATSAEYVLLSEVLEDAWWCVDLVARNHRLAAKLPTNVKTAILALESHLADRKLSELSWIEATADPSWHALRAQAANVFTAMGASLAEWEQRVLRGHDA